MLLVQMVQIGVALLAVVVAEEYFPEQVDQLDAVVAASAAAVLVVEVDVVLLVLVGLLITLVVLSLITLLVAVVDGERLAVLEILAVALRPEALVGKRLILVENQLLGLQEIQLEYGEQYHNGYLSNY